MQRGEPGYMAVWIGLLSVGWKKLAIERHVLHESLYVNLQDMQNPSVVIGIRAGLPLVAVGGHGSGSRLEGPRGLRDGECSVSWFGSCL